MPLHRLQSYPPGLPDLRQGKWGPQDLLPRNHTKRNAKRLYITEKEDKMASWQVLLLRTPGWAVDPTIFIQRGVLLQSAGAFLQGKPRRGVLPES